MHISQAAATTIYCASLLEEFTISVDIGLAERTDVSVAKKVADHLHRIGVQIKGAYAPVRIPICEELIC
jgi:energy-converting hydrogenase Eha subunit B